MNDTETNVEDVEANAADRALAREIDDQQRKIRSLEHDAEQAKGFVQQSLDQLHQDRQHEDDVRARLALARQQFYNLTHPAKGVCLPVGVASDAIRAQLDEHAHQALTGRIGAAEGTAPVRHGGGASDG